MEHQQSAPKPSRKRGHWSLSPTYIRLVLYVSLGIIVFFLVTEHAAHLAGLLPYSFLFLCLLMHLFMHGGHGGHSGDGGANDSNQSR
jgi:Protein of unknown function (DUF2933)